jgi:SpoVK/Ycf46/Vps4 family AAA+-type ATPase
MFKKKYFLILLLIGFILFSGYTNAQKSSNWVRVMQLHTDSTVLSKQDLQQLKGISSAPVKRMLLAGTTSLKNKAIVSLLAKKWNKELYRVDLSQVVSKYIGETEKNLSAVFSEVRGKDIVLFFDEADALFGKRTTVSDAHDKYANQEVSYLMKQLEDFNGLAILATNMRTSIDSVVLRKFYFLQFQ